MRFCSKCFLCKDFSEFPRRKDSSSGYRTYCRDCKNKQDFNYSKKRVEETKIIKKKYFDKNKQKIHVEAKKRRIKNIEAVLIKQKKYRDNNRERVREIANAWYHANKQKVFEKIKFKRNNNPFFKMKCSLKGRVQMAFKYKSWKKDSLTKQLLGVDYETAKQHIERQFKKGMTWENYGRYTWHIDHKIPLASAKNVEELKALCHYTNLQPMWAQQNILKADKILPTQMVLTI